MSVLGLSWGRSEAVLRKAFDQECERCPWPSVHSGKPEVFCIAMAQVVFPSGIIGPGYPCYRIRPLDKDYGVGVALAGWVDTGVTGERLDPVEGRVYARVAGESFSAKLVGVRGGRNLVVSVEDGQSVDWRVMETNRYLSARVGGAEMGGLTVENNRAVWSPRETGVASEFRLSLHRTFREHAIQLARQIRETTPKHDDVLFNRGVDYGIPHWGLAGALLGIRMLLQPEDFD